MHKTFFAALATLGMSSLVACSPALESNPIDIGTDAGDAGKDAQWTPDGAPVVIDAGPIEGQLTSLVQMNDVSLLFPLPRTAAEVADGYLRLNHAGTKGVLMPSALYEQTGRINGLDHGPVDPTPGVNLPVGRYENLRIVAARIDPCFAALAAPADGRGCTAQVRLIAQDVREDGTAADSGMHLFYEVTRDEVRDLLRSVARLREIHAPGADMGGLAPHPIAKEQGLAGPWASAVRGVLLRFAGVNALTDVTTFKETVGAFSWEFHSFKVNRTSEPKLEAVPIDTLSIPSTMQTIVLQNPPVIHPPTKATDSFVDLFATGATLPAARRSAAFDGLLRVDNPHRNSPKTIDCVSCHIAGMTSTRSTALGLSPSGNANRFGSDGAYVKSADTVMRFGPGDDSNLHVFSYFNERPTILQRVINETADVVRYVNANRLY